MPIRKVLIANRGEISIRIARAAAGLGIPSVSVFTPTDKDGLHVRAADDAEEIGDYLNVDDILNAAQQSGCDSVHPGYGFLSENADLARRCEEASMSFIGPSADSLTLFGDKIRARNLAASLNVPILPGSYGAVNSGEAIRELVASSTNSLKYPIMLKASAGGGGRGIRIARSPDEVDDLLGECARESLNAFGDGSVFVEQFLEKPRHIEVQIVADLYGNTNHLFERDCSVQLRNQKLVEIGPAPNLKDEMRDSMHEAAIKLCKSANYANLGTVEFLLEGDNFFFMEMNPRIQVEHTVTEEITGHDLVETQFLISEGHTLSDLGLGSEATYRKLGGKFAIQTRVSSTKAGGTFSAYKEPSGPGIRVDSCAYLGLTPPVDFDPLFAKLICSHANSLDGAVRKTRRALSEFHVEGIDSNIDNLMGILDHPEFYDSETGEYVATTQFLRDNPELTDQSHLQSVSSDADQILKLLKRAAALAGERVTPTTLSKRKTIKLEKTSDDALAIESPLQGALVEIRAQVGDTVTSGDTVAILTSMKMETKVEVPPDVEGIVVAVSNMNLGDTVKPGDEIMLIRPEKVLAGQSSVGVLDSESGWKGHIDGIHERRRQAKLQGGEDNVAKHHSKGKLTIRERISLLIDYDSKFEEVGRIAGSSEVDEETGKIKFTPGNFVLGTGSVEGRCVVVAGEDFTMSGGSPNLAGLRKSVYTESLALKLQCPLVRLHEGSGGSVGGGRKKGGGNAGAPVYEQPRFATIADCLGTLPVCTVASGSVAGLPASRFVASHFSVMVRSAALLTAGPQIVSRALGYDASKYELGGEEVHRESGIPDNFAETEEDALEQVRRFLSFLPPNVFEPPPIFTTQQGEDSTPEEQIYLRQSVPMSRKESYDVRQIIKLIVDKECGGFFEIGTSDFGATQVTGLGRINGQTVAIMANDNNILGGAMTCDGADKVVKFLEFAQTFGLPVLALVDEPGFMIGIAAEKAGTIRRGTRAVLTAHKYPHPWCTVLVRRAYGVAAAAHFGPDAHVLSWPSAETGTLPVESGVAVAFSKVIASANDPEKKRAELEAAFSEGLNPFPAAENFCVHDLIDPGETRSELCTWLRITNNSRMQKARYSYDREIALRSGVFLYRG